MAEQQPNPELAKLLEGTEQAIRGVDAMSQNGVIAAQTPELPLVRSLWECVHESLRLQMGTGESTRFTELVERATSLFNNEYGVELSKGKQERNEVNS